MVKEANHTVQQGLILKGHATRRGLKTESATLAQCNYALQYLASEDLQANVVMAITDADNNHLGFIATNVDFSANNLATQFAHKVMHNATLLKQHYDTPLSCVAQALNVIAADLDQEKPVPAGTPTRVDTLSIFQRAMPSTSTYRQ